MIDIYNPTLKFCFTIEGLATLYDKYRREAEFMQAEKLDDDAEQWNGVFYTKALYATAGAAAFDLLMPEEVVLIPNEVTKVDLGIAIDLSAGQAALLLPRSSNGKPQYRVSLSNTVGLIDSDFKGSIQAMFVTASDEPVTLYAGTRFAQLMIVPVLRPQLELIAKQDFYDSVETNRCCAGFGTTGK